MTALDWPTYPRVMWVTGTSGWFGPTYIELADGCEGVDMEIEQGRDRPDVWCGPAAPLPAPSVEQVVQ